MKPKNTQTSQAVIQNVYSKLEAGLHQKKTEHGMALLGDPKQIRSLGLTAQLIADGDFDQHVELLAYQITLRRLGCDSNKGLASMESLFQTQYKNYVQQLDDVPHAAESLVRDIQVALTHLHYLPFMSRADGLYGDVLVSAMKKFQLDHNEKPDGLPKLQVNGIVTADVLAALQAKLIALKKKLDILGFNKATDTSGSKNTLTFPQLVRLFSERDGSTKKTPSTSSSSSLPVIQPQEPAPASPLTDEERNLLDNVGVNKTSDSKKPKERSKPKKEDAIERELLKKLSILSTSVSTEQISSSASPTPEDEEVPGECYVVCERERSKGWISEFDLDLVAEREVMTGT